MASHKLKVGEVGFGTPFAEQIEFLRAKMNLPTQRWDDIKRAAHDRAFIVAGAGKADLLYDLHQAMGSTQASGGGLGEFRQKFKAMVAKNGWTGWTGEGSAAGEAWRTKVIYQTNMATSYAAGRWRQLTDPDFLKLRPYWRYNHADGVLHPRAQHQAWDGLTLRYDHPFYRTHFAPNGWGCHCWINAVAKPAAGDATTPPDGWDTLDPATGAPVGIDKGFDYEPGASVDLGLRDMVQRRLITYPPAITRALSHDLTRYLNADGRPADFARRVLADRSINETAWLGFVERLDDVGAAAGVDVSRYLLTLPADAVNHVDASHGHDGNGQRPARPEDYDLVEQVLNKADKISAGNKEGTVLAVKAIEGETYRAVFRVLSGKKNQALALLSLVIKTR